MKLISSKILSNKSKLIHVVIIVSAIFMFPSVIASLLRATQSGWNNVMYLHIFIFFCFCFLAIFIKKLSFNFKAHSFIILFTILSFAGLISYKLTSGLYLIFPAIIMSALLYNIRISLTYFFIFILGFILIGLLHLNNIFDNNIDYNSYQNNLTTWIAFLLGYTFVNLTFIYIGSLFFNLFTNTIQSLEKKTEELNTALNNLKYSEERFKSFMENIPAYTYIKNKNLELTYYNSIVKHLIDDKKKQTTKSKGLFDPDTVKTIQEADQKIIDEESEGEILDYRIFIHNKYCWLRDIKFPLISPNGDKGVGGVAWDITERKETEIAFRKEKLFADFLINSMPGMYYLYKQINNNFYLIRWNKNHESLTEYSAEELENFPIQNFFDPLEWRIIENELGNTIKSGSGKADASITTKSGKSIPFHFEAYFFESKESNYLTGVGINLTEQKKREKELVESNENFQTIYNSSNDAIIIINEEYKIIDANTSFLKLAEINQNEIPSDNILSLIPDNIIKNQVKKRLSQITENSYTSYEYSLKNKSGNDLFIETKSKKIIYNGNPAILITISNVTERKKLERQVYISSLKGDEIERVRSAKEIHEGLGPLLSACKLYLHNLKNSSIEKTESESLKNLEELIDNALVEIKDISNNISPHILRNFGLVHALNSFIEKTCSKNLVKTSFVISPSKRFHTILEVTVYRVLLELIINSVKFSQAGNIEISIEEKADNLYITYADNGVGFDYQKTIKTTDGVGLVNIQNRVKSIGGQISYTTAPGKGVHVEISLNQQTNYD